MWPALELKIRLGEHAEALQMIQGYQWDDAQTTTGIVAFGKALVTGSGAIQNFEVGLDLLRRAAETGNAEAMIGLARAYDGGLGVEKDEDQGFAWLRRAADTGAMNPMQWTAQRYDRLKDWENAAVWWLRCANWPSTASYPQRTLAERYRDGKGVEKDMVKAYIWANLASRSNALGTDAEAAALRDLIAKELSSDQLKECQRRSWEWRPGQEV